MSILHRQIDPGDHFSMKDSKHHAADPSSRPRTLKSIHIHMKSLIDLLGIMGHRLIEPLHLRRIDSLLFAKHIGAPIFTKQMIFYITSHDKLHILRNMDKPLIDKSDLFQRVRIVFQKLSIFIIKTRSKRF